MSSKAESHPNCKKCEQDKLKKEESKRKREEKKKLPPVEQARKKAKAISEKAPKQVTAFRKLCGDFPGDDEIKKHCDMFVTSLTNEEDELNKVIHGKDNNSAERLKYDLNAINERITQISKTIKEMHTTDLLEVDVQERLNNMNSMIGDISCVISNQTPRSG